MATWKSTLGGLILNLPAWSRSLLRKLPPPPRSRPESVARLSPRLLPRVLSRSTTCNSLPTPVPIVERPEAMDVLT